MTPNEFLILYRVEIICLLAFPSLRYFIFPLCKWSYTSAVENFSDYIEGIVSRFIRSWRFEGALKESQNKNKDLPWIVSYKCHITAKDKQSHYESAEVRDLVSQLHRVVLLPNWNMGGSCLRDRELSLVERVEALEKLMEKKR